MTRIAGCRSCGHAPLTPALDLGSMPLANALVPATGAVSERLYPLELVYCPSCSLAQITETVPPEELFGDYVYFSSYSTTMLNHASRLAESLIKSRQLTGESLVIEAASNDGYLLQYFSRRGIPVLGIEPAANVAEVARRDRNVETLTDFFGVETARRLRAEARAADVIIGINVLAHVADLNGFVEGLRTILKPGGIAVIEVPYVMDLIGQGQFDTIYHEHLCYFSLGSLQALFGRHGLEVTDAERIPIHGGSLRVQASIAGETARAKRVDEALAGELSGLPAGRLPDRLTDFADRVKAMRTEIPAFLRARRAQGRRIAAYGAAAKGAVLMNYCDLREDLIEFVVDRNPAKQGKRMPGTRQLIHDPSELLTRRPDDLMILPWNIAEEIVKQESAFAVAGGRFIAPVPRIRELSSIVTS